jgi:F1F0 ATPase subunit 2
VSVVGINAVALAVGGVLGFVFFGGLWWTVRNALTAANPALVFLASLMLRTGIVLTGVYYVAGNGWLSVLLCLCGFITARVVVTRITQQQVKVLHAS